MRAAFAELIVMPVLFHVVQAEATSASGSQKLEQALVDFQRGEWEASEPYLQNVWRKGGPDEVRVLRMLARGYREAYHHDKALTCLAAWLERQPGSAEAHLWRGEVLQFRNDDQGAVNEYRKVVDLAPTDMRARLRLAEHYLAAVDVKEATPHFQQLRKQQPHNPQVLLGMARCHELLGQREEARKLLAELMASRKPEAAVFRQAARIAFTDGKLDKAESLLRKALALAPADIDSIYLRYVQLLRIGNRTEANIWLEKYKSVSADMVRARNILSNGGVNPKPQQWSTKSQYIRLSWRSIHLGAGPPPGTSDLHAELGAILVRNSRGVEGTRWLGAALRKNPRHRAARETLYAAMRGKDVLVAVHAAAVLGRVEPNDVTVVSVMLESLRDQEPAVRRFAAMAIGQIRPSDEAVIPALNAHLHDSDQGVRAAAKGAIEKLKH